MTSLFLNVSASATSSPAVSLECSGTYLEPMGAGNTSLPSEGEVSNFHEELLGAKASFQPKSFPGADLASVISGDQYIKYIANIKRAEEYSDVNASISVMDKVSDVLLGTVDNIILTKKISDDENNNLSLARTSFQIMVRLSSEAIAKIQEDTGGYDEYGNKLMISWIKIICRQK